MPQHTLFTNHQRLVGLDIQIRDRTPDLIDACDFTFIQHYDQGSRATVSSVRLSGRQIDYADTLVEQALTAFLWGKAGDVARAVASVYRDARRHARDLDRVGS